MTNAVKSPRGRGRPRKVPGSGTDPHEEILQVAATLFSTNGVGATRITDIAAAVGISAPTIYYHFESRDAIVETLMRFVVEESAAFASQEARKPGPSSKRLHALLEQHVQRLTSGPYDVWFLTQLTGRDVCRSLPIVERRTRQWLKAVERLIKEGVAGGEFREVDTKVALAMVRGMVHGALQLRHENAAFDPGAVAEFVVRSLAISP